MVNHRDRQRFSLLSRKDVKSSGQLLKDSEQYHPRNNQPCVVSIASLIDKLIQIIAELIDENKQLKRKVEMLVVGGERAITVPQCLQITHPLHPLIGPADREWMSP